MPFTEDFSPFFNPSDFGEAAGDILWKPSAGGEYTVQGIFDDAHSISEPGSFEAQSSLPQIWSEQGQFTQYSMQGVTNGDGFEVRGLDYKVRSVEPDGTGFLVIQLSKDEE